MSWVVEAFGSWYPVVYPHRDEAEAGRLIEGLGRFIGWQGRSVLDVGCGTGRHLAHLKRTGAKPIGMDLSAALLAEARAARTADAGDWALVRGDMRRLPFAENGFDVVASFFTSFGYFGEAEDGQALAEAARVLRTDGWHVLDYLNRAAVLAHPMRIDERIRGSYLVREQRRLDADGRRVIKQVEIRRAPSAASREQDSASDDERLASYEERVMLYRPEEVRALLHEAGLEVAHEWGDYSFTPFDASSSARQLVLSRKVGA